MQTKIYHGNLTPRDLADTLMGYFNRGEWRVQQFGSESKIVIQIATRQQPRSGGKTALTINLEAVLDGVAVQVGKQAWLGVATSLGTTVLHAWRNPWSLISRLDDIAQDFENLNLSEQVWTVLEDRARAAGATTELSDRLRRLVCEYCEAANPVGEANCIACGAPLGSVQPVTCKNCGFILRRDVRVCPNCQTEARISI